MTWDLSFRRAYNNESGFRERARTGRLSESERASVQQRIVSVGRPLGVVGPIHPRFYVPTALLNHFRGNTLKTGAERKKKYDWFDSETSPHLPDGSEQWKAAAQAWLATGEDTPIMAYDETAGTLGLWEGNHRTAWALERGLQFVCVRMYGPVVYEFTDPLPRPRVTKVNQVPGQYIAGFTDFEIAGGWGATHYHMPVVAAAVEVRVEEPSAAGPLVVTQPARGRACQHWVVLACCIVAALGVAVCIAWLKFW